MNWDNYFLTICKAVSSKSPCLSRQIGAVIARDHSIISTGYNGPPRGVPHCGVDRWEADVQLKSLAGSRLIDTTICPRRFLNVPSGERLDLCPAQHAEENAVSNAARIGASTIGATLYLNTVIPCQKCYGTLINAGIVEIVCMDLITYDKFSQFIIDHSNINLRTFGGS